MTALLDTWRAIRRTSTPLVALTTPDPAATIATLVEALNGKAETTPILRWDCVRGLVGLNEPGRTALAEIQGGDDLATVNLVDALLSLRRLSDGAVAFVQNAHRFLAEPAVAQAIWNLRDAFKADGRTLVLMAPDFTLPAELQHDVTRLDEPLPDDAQLAAIVTSQLDAAGMSPDGVDLPRAVDAVRGLAAFPAEQATALSLRKDGLDLPGLWERKRQTIDATPGLSVYRGRETFADLGGLDGLRGFCRRVLDGRRPPRAVVFLDEIEKALAGAGTDSSGISGDYLGQLLSWMTDRRASGLLLVGPPGTGKSAIAKAMGGEGGIPTISLDLGGLKNSLVGASEERMRTALRVIDAVAADGGAFVVATSNNIAALPPELRRRFGGGTWFVDLPTAPERAAIWRLWLARTFGDVCPETLDPTPDLDPATVSDAGWTGAEIAGCVGHAWNLDCSLVDASRYIVPVCRAAADQIARLRREASGRYLAASDGGIYQHTDTATAETPARSRALRTEA